MTVIELFKSLYMLGILLSLLFFWSGLSSVKAMNGERNSFRMLDMALDTIGFRGFLGLNLIFSYLFLIASIIMMIYSQWRIMSLLSWQDNVWVSATIAFIGQRHFHYARHQMLRDFVYEGFIGEFEVNLELFGLALMFIGLLYGLLAKDAPFMVMTIFDLMP